MYMETELWSKEIYIWKVMQKLCVDVKMELFPGTVSWLKLLLKYSQVSFSFCNDKKTEWVYKWGTLEYTLQRIEVLLLHMLTLRTTSFFVLIKMLLYTSKFSGNWLKTMVPVNHFIKVNVTPTKGLFFHWKSSYVVKQFWKRSENFKKNTHAEVILVWNSFSEKLACNFIKTRTLERTFSSKVSEKFKNSFSTDQSRWLLLYSSWRLLLS